MKMTSYRETAAREYAAITLAAAMAAKSPRCQRKAHEHIAAIRPRTRRLAAYLRALELLSAQLGYTRAEAVANLQHQLTTLLVYCGDELAADAREVDTDAAEGQPAT